MKFTKNRKRFWTLSRSSDGFTLVELIVVIAILAILAGVAVPAYSGYIKKANMAADQALVGEVRDALQLAVYAQTSLTNGAVVLSVDETVKYIDEKGNVVEVGAVADAIAAVFGSDAKASLTLSYDGWGGATSTANAVANFGKWGAAGDTKTSALAGLVATGDSKVTPTFANDIEDLYGLIQDTAVGVGGKLGSNGAALIQGAADLTMKSDKLATDQSFASAWANAAWNSDMFMDGTSYDENVNKLNDEDALNNAIANAAVIKARNTAFARYAAQNGVDAEICAAIENCSFGTTGTAAQIPQDFSTATYSKEFWIERGFSEDTFNALSAPGSAFMTAFSTYFGMTDAGFADPTTTLAYKDGLAYYALMNTVDAVGGTADDSTYWTNMEDAVNTYAKIARGELTLEELEGFYAGVSNHAAENSIVVTVVNGNVVVAPGEVFED